MNVTRCFFSSKLVTAAALIAFGISTTHVWGAVVITGDPTTMLGVGLQRIGNSQDAALKADTSGIGFAYDVYTGRYTVSASDSTSGANLIGNTGQGATGGSFNVGDDIYVIGWKSTVMSSGKLIASTGDNFLKLNPTGNAGYQPASAPGGAKTSFTLYSKPGDAQLQNSRNGTNFRFKAFAFNQDTDGITYPLQTGVPTPVSSPFNTALENLPFRAFGVNTAGSGATAEVTSQLYLLNVTDLNASTFGGVSFNTIGADLPFYMQISRTENLVANRSGVVISAASAVPEPASFGLMLAGAGILLLASRRRRDKTRAELACDSV